MRRDRFDRSRADTNQTEIVKALRKLGVSVEVGHDDCLIGWKGKTYWFEIKDPKHVSKKTGLLREGAIKPSQKVLIDTFKGYYAIVWSLEQILLEIGIN